MNREHVMAVLYDMAMVVGGEVRLRPLLTRALQRLLYHTSFPVGLLFLGPPRPAGDAGGAVDARLEVAIGDWELCALEGQDLRLPAGVLSGPAGLVKAQALLGALPPTRRSYGVFLRLPIEGEGVILLLAPEEPHSGLPLAHVFQPVMANLARAIVLCRHYEADATALEAGRARAEQELRDSAETVRAMAEAALDAILMCDPEGRITYWNPAAERVFGYAAGEVLGKALHTLLIPPRLRGAGIEEGFRRFRETGQGPVLNRLLEREALRKDGTTFPVELSISPVRLEGRWNAVGILRDVSERRRIEDQLRQSQKLESVARLAGGVAHDFNNLLTAILGGVDVLLEQTAGSPDLHRDVQEIELAARRGASLTRQLLIFSRKEVVQPAVLDVNEIVKGMGRMLRRLIGEDVELAVIPGQGIGHVKADPGQLEQVILNLAVNARDAMPHGGRLTIETVAVEGAARPCGPEGAAAGPRVRITVKDTGAGMDAHVRAHLFEPFFTTKEAGKGTGLGLSTVYGIVRQAGGSIDVESAPGAGTTFVIELPRTDDAPDPLTQAAAHEGTGDRRRETILLVEDDGLVRRLAGNVLRSEGYTVLEAVDGLDALAVAATEDGKRIALLVTDLVMPRLGGEGLAARLREDHPGIQVLFMSGYPEHGIEPGMMGEGSAFLQKPFTSAGLATAVQLLLDQRRPVGAEAVTPLGAGA